jgi:PIN domain nuclease of toxin-antitoxin system
MKYPLDTHTFIWWNTDSKKLSPNVYALFQNRSNQLHLSLASVWEMQIKVQIGKLNLPAPLEKILEIQEEKNQIELLPITLKHVLALDHLPLHHRDPFDRMLIAQAQYEEMTVISHDVQLSQYNVQIIW